MALRPAHVLLSDDGGSGGWEKEYLEPASALVQFENKCDSVGHLMGFWGGDFSTALKLLLSAL